MNKPITSETFYIDFIDSLQSNGKVHLKEHYLKSDAFFKNGLHLLPCVMYLLNFQRQCFLFISDEIKHFIGYSSEDFYSFGHSGFLDLFNPEDLKEYIEPVFKEFVSYTSNLNKEQIKNIRFSVNYRIKHKQGHYIQLLDQFIVLETNENNYPIIILGIYNDITTAKTDDKIIFTITEIAPERDDTLIFSKTFPERVAVTPKEKEILRLLKNGETSKSIATKLNISYHTVNAHRRNILEKFKFKNTSELISYCMANEII